MVNSMTGFGQAQKEKNGERVTITIRSVNHRYFEPVFHMPPHLESLESEIRSRIQKKIRRGRLGISLHLVNQSAEVVVLNEVLVKKYYKSLKSLGKELKIQESLNLNALVSLPGVLNYTKASLTPQVREKLIKSTLDAALMALVKMRRREGSALEQDLKKRIKRIGVRMNTINRLVDQLLRREKTRMAPEEWEGFLRSRNVGEEVTRIDFHLKSFVNHLKTAEPKGKVLDFVAQELQREINTLSAKSQDKHIVYQAVMVKDQIEKIREQVQNVE